MTYRFKELLATDTVIPLFAVARRNSSMFLVNPKTLETSGQAKHFDHEWMRTVEQIRDLAIAGRANEFDCFVRQPPVGYWQVTQNLEAGASGVMAAQIYSVEQAREFVSWAKFAPEGTRGMNTGGRDSDFTHTLAAQFGQESNLNNFVAIQIETLRALEQADEIAALQGVDVLFIGPVDLSLALGVVGQFHHKKLWDAIARVAEACHKHGKNWGCVAPDLQFADRAVEAGCRMPTFASDVTILRRGIEKIHEVFSNHLEQRT